MLYGLPNIRFLEVVLKLVAEIRFVFSVSNVDELLYYCIIEYYHYSESHSTVMNQTSVDIGYGGKYHMDSTMKYIFSDQKKKKQQQN